MHLKDIISKVVTVLLIVILGCAVFIGGETVYQYYTGPDYVVDRYLKSINNKDYAKTVSYLDKASTMNIGSNKEVIKYYKMIYDEQTRLIDAEKIGKNNGTYNILYRYLSDTRQGELEVVKTGHTYSIKFPFEKNEVVVNAPYGAEVYLDSKRMTYSEEDKCYKLSGVLPGNYMLEVTVNRNDYKDYYKMLTIPYDNNYTTPYNLAHIVVDAPEGFNTIIGDYSKDKIAGNDIEFNNILAGNYEIEVNDRYNNFIPQKGSIVIKDGENRVNLSNLELSEIGKKKLENFLSSYYQKYDKAINNREAAEIEKYLTGENKDSMIEEFKEWFIENKNVIDSSVDTELKNYTIDDKGLIHAEIVENVEIKNREFSSEYLRDLEKEYKIVLTWETVIDPLNDTWKVVSRTNKESIVAVKDSQGNWVQY